MSDDSTMETLSQAINRLRSAGYSEDYHADRGALVCGRCGRSIDSVDMAIDEIVRFEGDSDPADEAIVVALDAGCGHRGLYVAGYGPTMSADDAAALASLPDTTP